MKFFDRLRRHEPMTEKEKRDLEEAKRRRRELLVRLASMGIEADVIVRRGDKK